MTAPRLHVVPAIACDKALVLRRGPTDHVASILWDRATNEFQLGQWLKGRIYEHRSDLAPDGRHMIYFAGKGIRWWTAVSRAPWLTALAFEPQNHTWHGGGAFTKDGCAWLNGDGDFSGGAPDGLTQANPSAYPHGTDGFHMGELYAAMMERRGWRHAEGERYDARLDKQFAGDWRLELEFDVGRMNRSIISNKYKLTHAELGCVADTRDWEWAEPWADGLQIAARGGLHFVPMLSEGPGAPTLIRDFGGMEFEERIAPYRGVER